MNVLTRIWHSSLGKKYIMAVTGGLLVLFVIGHMLGNLQIFLGPDALNTYAYFLQHKPALVWAVRLGLLAIVGLHITSAIRLSLENKAARPIPYARQEWVAATYASRTMLMSGLIVATFIVYHLLHFTVDVPALNGTGLAFKSLHDAAGRHDVYTMVILGFRQPVVSGVYLVGMFLLCLHLRHGIASTAQSLGLRTPGNARFFELLAWAIAILLFVGNSSIPLAILCGYGKEVLI